MIMEFLKLAGTLANSVFTQGLKLHCCLCSKRHKCAVR